jgi:hypothetical protein
MKLLKKFLPIPQQYEIQKIGKYTHLDNLLQFALENSKRGVEQFFPVSIN